MGKRRRLGASSKAEAKDLSFDDLLNAADELELMPLVKRAVESRGAEWFVFVSLHPTNHSTSRSTYRFLIGCRPEWRQLYNANRWYLTDPCLEHARSNTAPVLGSALPIQTVGQQHMLKVAAENGFRSIYIVPAHASEKGRIGVLYLSSNFPYSNSPVAARSCSLRYASMET